MSSPFHGFHVKGKLMGKSALYIALATWLLAGCSMTLPVRGMIQDTPETFTGSATGYMGGYGTLEVTSIAGAKCTGDFVYVTPRQGSGVFSCDDGRSGPFEFVSTGSRGNGYGSLDGKRFTFTFGK